MNEIGLKCRSCDRKWKLILPSSETNITAFAAICDCGEIFAGNIKNMGGEILSNASFDVINITEDMPILRFE